MSERLRAGRIRRISIGVVALVAAVMAVGAAQASAASPVLEFSSSSPFPIRFTAQGGAVTAELEEFPSIVHCAGSSGEGTIMGPQHTLSHYVFTGCEADGGGGPVPCRSNGGAEGEIKTPPIAANLVWLDQAKGEVGMVLQPDGGVYMEFECFGIAVTAYGPFVSRVDPINQEGTSFTASLGHLGAIQIPSAYEGPNGETIAAVPSGEIEEEPAGRTGVGLSFAIYTDLPVTVKAITAKEVEAKQREEEAAAAKKKREEDEAAAKKKKEEEAAAKKRQEEEAAAKKQQEAKRAHARAQAQARKRHLKLTKALKQCHKIDSRRKRVSCEQRAKKRFAAQKAPKP